MTTLVRGLGRSRADQLWLLAGMIAAAAIAAVSAWFAYELGPLVVPALAAVTVFVYLAVARPWIALGLAFVMTPLEAYSVPLPTGAASPAEAGIALIGVAWLARAIIRPETIVKPSARDIPFAVLLGVIAVGLTFAPEPEIIARTLVLWTLFYFVYLQVQTFTPEQMRVALLGLVVGAGILGATGTIQFIQSGGSDLYAGGSGVTNRVSATFATATDTQSPSNYFASALELAAIPAIALIIADFRRNGWLLPAAALASTGLFLSLSRGGTLGFAAGILFLMAFWAKARWLAGGLAALVLALTIAGANPLLGSDAASTVQQRLTSISDNDDTTTNLRPRVYAAAADISVQHPLAGIGVGQFEGELAKRGGGLTEQGRPLEGAHNVLLSFAAETGLIGLGAFVFFLAIVIGRAAAALRSRDLLVRVLALGGSAALFGFMVQGMTVTQNRHNLLWAIFLALAGMVVALGDRATREAEASELDTEPARAHGQPPPAPAPAPAR